MCESCFAILECVLLDRQSLYHLAAKADKADEAVLSAVRQQVMLSSSWLFEDVECHRRLLVSSSVTAVTVVAAVAANRLGQGQQFTFQWD